jgi:two-component system, NarL family, sensor histidine kinase BarA
VLRERFPFRQSLRFRLSILVGFSILLVVMVTAVVSAWHNFDREIDNHRALLEGAGSVYVAALSDSVAARDRQAALSSLRGVRHLPNVRQTDIVLVDGQTFAQLGSGAMLVRQSGDPDSMSRSQVWSARFLRFEFPIVRGGKTIATLGMLSDISVMRRAVIDSLLFTGATAFIAILFGVSIAQALIARMTRPLRQLTAQMSRFGMDGNADLPRISGGQDETGILANAFNDMITGIRDRDLRIARHMETLEETVEVRTRDLRLARDESQAANAAKSDFLATMSHEIRTPMNGMLVMAEMLSSADLSSRHRRYADIICRSGKGLLTIINDILDLSKIESGNLLLESIPVSPETLAIDVVSLFSEKARESQLELSAYVSPRVPELLMGDPTRLNQIMTNLVNNALKFTETGGVLICLDSHQSDVSGMVRLIVEVEDTGIGIPEDRIDSIFDSFSQADQTTTRQYGGTGLGLSVCRKLVTAMGGQIFVNSKPGEGSTFRVEIDTPVATAAPETKSYPLRISVCMPVGIEHRALSSMLVDFGCELNNQDPDLVIGKSAFIAAGQASPLVPSIVLSDIGDMCVDDLLRGGIAADCLTAPHSRADLASLLECAATNTFRGAAALRSEREHGAKETFDGLRVLAADDNAVNREVLSEALGLLKVDAVFVDNGAEAVRQVAGDHFDLVFMDGSMPVMDGIEAVKLIRSAEHSTGKQRTPIVALTAQVAGYDSGAWHAAGVDGYITKPFSLEQLSQAISAACGAKLQHAAPQDSDPSSQVHLLDQVAISTLESLGNRSGRDVRGRVWSMFKEQVMPGLDGLESLAQSGSGQEISRKAHALKSMALNAGAGRLAILLGDIERAATNVAPAETYESVKDARRALTETVTAMQEYEHTKGRTNSDGCDVSEQNESDDDQYRTVTGMLRGGVGVS